jgi:hypothetical protein
LEKAYVVPVMRLIWHSLSRYSFIHSAATIISVITIMYLHYYYYYYYYYYIYQCAWWFIKNVADFQWTKVTLSRNWINCVKCVAYRTYRSVTNSLSSTDIVFWKFVELCEMCCISCSIYPNFEVSVLQYSRHWVGSFLGSLWRW